VNRGTGRVALFKQHFADRPVRCSSRNSPLRWLPYIQSYVQYLTGLQRPWSMELLYQ
jgi:hypothetical protein